MYTQGFWIVKRVVLGFMMNNSTWARREILWVLPKRQPKQSFRVLDFSLFYLFFKKQHVHLYNQSFIFSQCFILVRVEVDSEITPGILRQEYTREETHRT